MSIITESSSRLLYSFIAQFILGVIFFFIFRHFSLVYRRKFLFTWALSWLAFSTYMLITAKMAYFVNISSHLRIIFNVLGQLTCYLQVVMLLKGTHELVTEKALNRRKFKVVFLAFFVIAVISVLLSNQSSADAVERHLYRVGSISLISGFGFLITGIVVWYHRKFTRHFSQKFFAAALILYSFYEFYYFMSVLFGAMLVNIELPKFYGVLDLLWVSIVGLSMVLWLLEDERQKLEKANKEMDRFLYGTSHDLRGPIASILGLTYIGKSEFQEEKARMFMQLVEDRIKKLDTVITDILSLSRTKKIEVKFEQLNFDKLLEDVITDIKFNKNASAITLEYDHQPSHVFKSDYSQMKIVLCNLLGNAVKYHNLNQERPFIKVSFKREEDFVAIEIQDNGQGIPKEGLPKIFDMFYRASENTEGTGLGLYIVNEALNKINGTINVESVFGKGSTFTVYLEEA